jgi:magnesium-protoporphyrin IX monomethyl ester (oxidative) cyclase
MRRNVTILARLLGRGQTNFVRSVWKFGRVYNPERQLADHRQPVTYAMRLPAGPLEATPRRRELYVLPPEPVT